MQDKDDKNGELRQILHDVKKRGENGEAPTKPEPDEIATE
jgi:hypothetical protein